MKKQEGEKKANIVENKLTQKLKKIYNTQTKRVFPNIQLQNSYQNVKKNSKT